MESTNSFRWILIGVLYIVEFALIFLSNGNLALLALVCAVAGWRVINMIQPSMFIWMPLVGWIIYFVIKFIIAYFVGLFVAPYTIGSKIAETLNNNR